MILKILNHVDVVQHQAPFTTTKSYVRSTLLSYLSN